MIKVNKKIIIVVITLVIVGCAVFGVKYLLDVKEYKDKINKITINDVNLNSIADGKYTGVCDVNFIKAKVVVNVENNKIDSIKLVEHKNERGQKAESIIKTVEEKDSLKVDTVSGATNSSKVILKAIENALES